MITKLGHSSLKIAGERLCVERGALVRTPVRTKPVSVKHEYV